MHGEGVGASEQRIVSLVQCNGRQALRLTALHQTAAVHHRHAAHLARKQVIKGGGKLRLDPADSYAAHQNRARPALWQPDRIPTQLLPARSRRLDDATDGTERCDRMEGNEESCDTSQYRGRKSERPRPSGRRPSLIAISRTASATSASCTGFRGRPVSFEVGCCAAASTSKAVSPNFVLQTRMQGCGPRDAAVTAHHSGVKVCGADAAGAADAAVLKPVCT